MNQVNIKFPLGSVVCPIISPETRMIVCLIEVSNEVRYLCNWFIQDELKTAYFPEYLLEEFDEANLLHS